VTTEKPTKEQLTKLPVWAQRLVADLREEVEAAKSEADTLRAALGEAPLEGASGLVTWSVLMDDYLLPDRASVRFHEANKGEKGYHRYIEVSLVKGSQGGRVLMIRGSDGRLVIQPEVSNVIVVSLGKWGPNE
jgi:hypothetical protein